MPRKGRVLELVVAAIEHAMADSQDVQVTSPGYLKDLRTGLQREFDVLLSINVGHHALTIAIEVRNRKQAIGVPEVEAFRAKCSDTNVNQCVMVSSTGFTSGARTKAGQVGVRCLHFKDAKAFDWFALQSMIVGCRVPTSSQLTLALEDDVDYQKRPYLADPASGTLRLTDASYAVVETTDILNAAWRQVDDALPEVSEDSATLGKEVSGIFPIRFDPCLWLYSDQSIERLKVAAAIAVFTYVESVRYVPLKLRNYEDADSVLGEVVESEPIVQGDHSFKILIAGPRSGSKNVSVISGPAESPGPGSQSSIVTGATLVIEMSKMPERKG